MSRIKDIPLGSRFGSLVVVSFAGIAQRFHASWNCVCDCGKEAVVLGTHLRRGKIRSCGHLFTTSGRRAHNFKDLMGQKFGRWTVVSFEGCPLNENGKRWAIWNCLCDCGNTGLIPGGRLIYGTSNSCGCLTTEVNSKGFGVSARNTVLLEYKSGAKSRDLSWDISDQIFDKITQDVCNYCGQKPSNVKNTGYNTGHFVYNGIDRVDNKRGYELGNIVPCCRICNRAKDVMSAEDFVNWATRVVEYSKKT